MPRAALAAAIALPLAGLVSLTSITAARAQPSQPSEPARPAQGAPNIGQMLIDGLKASEGCLGVDSARFNSGKTSIVAWFENAQAVETWYHSETHARVMGMFGADPHARKPLEHVENRDQPVMVIASITLGGDKPLPGPMPISQISIELFAPLPGGAAVNGRLSPEGFQVPHFRNLTVGD